MMARMARVMVAEVPQLAFKIREGYRSGCGSF
jgi:hypothetical protein